jgi:iron complex transport system ATP-binding protein
VSRAIPPADAAARPPIISMAGVSVAFGAREVLRSIELAVAPGERIALVGPNGAGKSTLIRAFSGTAPLSAGAVAVAGLAVPGASRELMARQLAIVPQVSMFPFATTVEQVVALGRLPHEDPIRGPRPADRAAIAAAIDRVGLGHLLGRDARELSLGEHQLVLIAVALAQSAPIVVLDEPTVHLDIRHQVEVMDLLVDLNERDGTTIVAVLHDLGLAARYCPRVAVLDGGRLAADGPPGQALGGARIRETFGIEPDLLPAGPWSAVPATAGSPAAVPPTAVPPTAVPAGPAAPAATAVPPTAVPAGAVPAAPDDDARRR